jgi:UDP-N-acetylglucosamine 1-carboxyvinyltransferase
MDSIIIRGGATLHGQIKIGGAKNAALPLMCASLLSDQPLELLNLPHLADINTLISVLDHLGVGAEFITDDERSDHLKLCCGASVETTAPYDMVRKMRASILVLGPLVARHGHARVSLPGGCAIGNRPIDLHLKGLGDLGAEIDLQDGYIEANTPNGGLKGAHVVMPSVSVGATENILMAATLAKGETVLENAAREPEIDDLANCLNAMGAKISNIGQSTLLIEGVETLGGATHRIMPDRIEAGSYAIAAAITGGALELVGANPAQMSATIEALREIGIQVDEKPDSITVTAGAGGHGGINLRTQPFPGFATDMQAQFMALLSLCDGASVITETIFENRFMHVPELARMGADITISGNVATIRGVTQLKGAQVMATDLRASMSLILAGLAARDETVVGRVYHLDRGYERLEDKLRAVGADIERVKS